MGGGSDIAQNLQIQSLKKKKKNNLAKEKKSKLWIFIFRYFLIKWTLSLYLKIYKYRERYLQL